MATNAALAMGPETPIVAAPGGRGVRSPRATCGARRRRTPSGTTSSGYPRMNCIA